MKRILVVLLVAVLLCGCSGSDEELKQAMELRGQWMGKNVCFDAEVTADYGDVSYTFSMACQVDTQGNMTFSVTQPDTLAGITGTVSATGGKLTFDGAALAFELMADGQLTPVSAPWVLMKTLTGGYLSSCCKEGDDLRLSIDDSYEEDALHLEIWVGADERPKNAEIYWQGRRLLTVKVSNFTVS